MTFSMKNRTMYVAERFIRKVLSPSTAARAMCSCDSRLSCRSAQGQQARVPLTAKAQMEPITQAPNGQFTHREEEAWNVDELCRCDEAECLAGLEVRHAEAVRRAQVGHQRPLACARHQHRARTRPLRFVLPMHNTMSTHVDRSSVSV